MADVQLDWDAQGANIPLYIFMLLYFIGIVVVGFIAQQRKKASIESLGAVAAQYGGEFSTMLVIMTTFSSVFSGYTVLGVPQEAARRGNYRAIRWVAAIFPITFGMLLYYPRLRRCAKERGYKGPNDFVTDRFKNDLLTAMTSFCACVPQVFYLTVQLVSFGELLNGITVGLVPKVWAMLIFAVLVLVMEKIGGMNSVVLSDAVQAGLMVVGFLALTAVILWTYGSLGYLGPADCPSLGYVNLTAKETFKKELRLDEEPPSCTPSAGDTSCKAFGCIASAEPATMTPPNRAQVAGAAWFSLNLFMFPLNPHMMQRAIIAPTDKSLRMVMSTLAVSPFLTMLPGIYAGIVVMIFSDSWPLSSSEASALPALNNELKKNGWFQYVLVAVLTCSALAAIMSTADSVILGVSNALSLDVYKGLLDREASEERVVMFGTFVSVVLMAISFIVGLFVDSSYFGTLLTIQNGILFQIGPVFILGLFTRVTGKAVISGMAAGLGTLAIILLLDVFGIDLSAMLMSALTIPVPQPNIAAIVNFLVTAAVQLAGVGSEGLDEETEKQRLTKEKIDNFMAEDVESNVILRVVVSLAIIATVPFYGDWVGGDLVWGVPRWTWVSLFICFFTSGLLIVTIHSWWPRDESEAPKAMMEAEMVGQSS